MHSLYAFLGFFFFTGLCSGQAINNVIKQIQPRLTQADIAKFLPQLQRQLQKTAQLELQDPNKRVGNPSVPWSYDKTPGNNGPDEWDTLEANWTCDGTKQSPVDVVTAQVMATDPNPTNLNLRVEPEAKPITGELKNNGYAPTLTVGEEITLKLTGGSLTEDYFLKQFHFHFGCNDTAGSEHTIDGNYYPLELHLVFWDNGNFQTFEDAAQGENGLAVIAVLFEKENEALPSPVPGNGQEVPESSLQKLIHLLAEIEIEGSTYTLTQTPGLHFNDMIPSLMSLESAPRFYQYRGSLTTPGCYESVTWFVMNNHPKVTELELTAFRQLQSSKVHKTGPHVGKMCGNVRPIQPIGGRQLHSNIVP